MRSTTSRMVREVATGFSAQQLAVVAEFEELLMQNATHGGAQLRRLCHRDNGFFQLDDGLD